MSIEYILPNIVIHNSFSELRNDKSLYERYYFFYSDTNRTDFSNLYTLQSAFIIAEPGYGKSRLLKELVSQASNYNKEAIFIDLKGLNTDIESYIGGNGAVCASSIKDEQSLDRVKLIKSSDNFVLKESESIIVCLDALDEVKTDKISKVVDWINSFKNNFPGVCLFITCRTHQFNKYQNLFSTGQFKFVTIELFSIDQTQQYLKNNGFTSVDIEKLISSIRVAGRELIIQVPRYLKMIMMIKNEEGIEHVLEMKRTDLFDYFIYKKLEKEDQVDNTQKRDLSKRMLEKMALVMEIYQTNKLSKEEFVTLLDDLQSNICISLLREDYMCLLYQRSVLKDNIDSIEFENTEFQEYLAMKELIRLGRVDQVFFDLAVDPQLLEIYPSWFNTISFLIELYPSTLTTLLDSPIAKKGEVTDEEFHKLILHINPHYLDNEQKDKVFKYIMDYYQTILHWIDHDIAENLSKFYNDNHMKLLKEYCKDSNQKGIACVIRRANVALLIGYLIKSGNIHIDSKKYWIDKLTEFVTEHNGNSVLQRRILFALGKIGDISLIKEIKPLLETTDELIEQELIQACIEVNPNDLFSIDCFVEGAKRTNIFACYGISAITEEYSIKYILSYFLKDERFLEKFIEREDIFKDKIEALINNIKSVWDNEILIYTKKLIITAFGGKRWYQAERSKFIEKIVLLIKENDSNYLSELIEDIKGSTELTDNLFSFVEVFRVLLQKTKVKGFIRELSTIEKGPRIALRTLLSFYNPQESASMEIYEEGRSAFKKEYQDYEKQSKNLTKESNEEEEIYKEFKIKLQPEPGKYSPNVFRHYLSNKEEIDAFITQEDLDRLQWLMINSVFEIFDPAKEELLITKKDNNGCNYTTSSFISVFGYCIRLAEKLTINVSKYRKKIIQYIPFSYSDHLESIFSLIPDPVNEEIEALLDMYLHKRKDDLAIFMPISFIDSCEKYVIKDSLSILKKFVGETNFSIYDRSKALRVIGKLKADANYLKKTFYLYNDKNKVEYQLAQIANEVLVEIFEDKEAIEWRFNELIHRAAPFKEEKDTHWVGSFEHELHDMEFASPIMKLKKPEYSQYFMRLVHESFTLLESGDEYWAYVRYLWKIVIIYFDNLKELKSYKYLKDLEFEVNKNYSESEGVNWFKYQLKDLKRSYINYIGKPNNFADCIKKYNSLKNTQYLDITTHQDLAEIVKTVIDEDIRAWVESEGAYKFINKAKGEQEDLIQKTLKSQLELCLLKRGLRGNDIRREEQLLNDLRTDFLISYGFIGPILIEVKRVDNKEIFNEKERLQYKTKLLNYIKGSRAHYGLFVIFQINDKKSLSEFQPKLLELYKDCKNIEVIGFNCT